MAVSQPATGVVPAAGKEAEEFSRPSFAQVLGKAMTDTLDDKPTDSTRFRKDGSPALRLSDSDVARGESHVSNHIVVMKFSSFRPSLDSIRDSIHRFWGISGNFIMGLIDPRHVMVYLQSEDEVKKVLSKESFTIRGVRYKMFRWHPGFSLRADPELAPLWVELPNLPFAFFLPAIMKAIGNSFGTFLRIDDGTRYFARPTVARMCVEMEVSKPLPHKIWLESPKYGGYWQKIEYPGFKYCDHCSLIGHEKDYCRKLIGRKNAKPTPMGAPDKELPLCPKSKQKQTLVEGLQESQEPNQKYVPVIKKARKDNGHIGTSGAKNSQGVEISSTPDKDTKVKIRGEASDNVISLNKFGALAEEHLEGVDEGNEAETKPQQAKNMASQHTSGTKAETENTQDLLKGAGYTSSEIKMARPTEPCDEAKPEDGFSKATPMWTVPFVADSSSEKDQGQSKLVETEDQMNSQVPTAATQTAGAETDQQAVFGLLEDCRDDCRDVGYSPNGIGTAIQAADSDAEVAAETGLSTPISNSEENPMQVMEVLRAIAGFGGLGEDPTTLMACLTPQNVKEMQSEIARIGMEAVVAELQTSIKEAAAKVGQNSSEKNREVTTIQTPTADVPRRSSRSKKTNPKFRQ